MPFVRRWRLVTSCAAALVALTPTSVGASTPASPWPVVLTHLPATLRACSTHQAQKGGPSFANLWTVQINTVDLVGEKIFRNVKVVTVKNPLLTLNDASSFSPVLPTPFLKQRVYIEKALAASLHLRTPSSEPTSYVVPASRLRVPPLHSLVLYATSAMDFSQGFFSNVSRGCNGKGAFMPWVLSTVATGPPAYHAIVVPTASLVHGGYQPPKSVALAYLTRLVTHANKSSTGPLPTGFGFPKIQTEFLRNDAVVRYSSRQRGSVFMGWLKDKLPASNRLVPFRIMVVRQGTW